MNYAGILAGGIGSRMGAAERPKQFLRLGSDETPILIHTLRVFLECPSIGRIVIATPAAWLEYTRVLIAENCTEEQQERICVIEGGQTRSDSLANICDYIASTYGLSTSDILVSHDAVRPFVTRRIIEENIKYAAECGCVDTVVPATDTIVVSKGGEEIDDIPQRSQFWQGQTPQSFSIRIYRGCYDALTDEQRELLTDACKVFLLNDRPVHLVMGEYSNIKITTPHDIYVATSILNGRKAEQS